MSIQSIKVPIPLLHLLFSRIRTINVHEKEVPLHELRVISLSV